MFFSEIDPDWQEIQKQFQNVCILRREGRNEEAVQLMEKKLSPLLASWTRGNQEAGPKKRERLEHLFEEEIKRVDDAWVTKNLLDDRLLKPFLNDLKQTLANIKENAAQRMQTPLDPTDHLDELSTTADFEVALEPIRIELENLKKSIALAQLNTPVLPLEEVALRKVLDDYDAANRSREEMFVTTYTLMRDEISSLKQQISEQNNQDKLIEAIGELKEQVKGLSDQVNTQAPEPDHSAVIQTIETTVKQAIDSASFQFAQQAKAITETISRKEQATTESIDRNQAKNEHMHQQLIDALEAVFNEHRSESAQVIQEALAATSKQDPTMLEQANNVHQELVMRVGKGLRSEIKAIRKQINSLQAAQINSDKVKEPSIGPIAHMEPIANRFKKEDSCSC